MLWTPRKTAALHAELAALKARNAELEKRLATIGTDAPAVGDGNDLAAAKGTITQLMAELNAERSSAAAKALEIVAGQGCPIIPIRPSANDGERKTRKEFSAMSPTEQSRFLKSGGKLAD